MKTAVLGFASVLSGGLALAPLLVQTDRMTLQALELPAAETAAAVITDVCGDASGWLSANGHDTKRYEARSDCLSAPGLTIASVR
ncbi:MAG: hypothetical protein F9K29_15485 [Hyphomicrobiaceae bacterium]|nr:MAG: hypothetical protein F9K29_15485 [Hyphomicrobiaceae bacterium]